LAVSPEKPAKFTLNLRLPSWARNQPLPGDLYSYENAQPAAWTVQVNGKKTELPLEHGYMSVSREWKTGDVVALDLPMPVRRVIGNEHISATRDRVALERGPIVYCLEGIDNKAQVSDCMLRAEAKITANHKAAVLVRATLLA